MNQSASGRRKEYAVRDHMISHGWTWIMRAAASKGAADLLMGHEEYGGALVQVGSKSKRLDPADRERFLRAAHLTSALPILAVHHGGQIITYHQINAGPPSTWVHWHPAGEPEETDDCD